MDISIIIVNYHSANLVIDCINSIFEKTAGVSFEIIVVDNASKDGSIERLKKAFGNRICLIASEKNLGFGKANNLGCQYARGEMVFLLNPDTILVNNAVKILYDALKNHQEYGVVGGNLYMPDMSPAPSFCLHFDDLETERKSASWQYLIGKKVHEKLGLNKGNHFDDNFNRIGRPIEVAYIFGADMMMRKSLFDCVAGFDPDFFMYAEEEELTWRIAQQGYKVMNIPEAQIIHLEGATTKQQNEFSEHQFKMRMTGTLTYYLKRFGEDGVHTFFNLRSKRYERLMKIAAMQGKLTEHFLPAIQKRCLEEVYSGFIKNM